MSNNNERFKMMKACLPPLENGAVSVSVIQNVTSPESDNYNTKLDFAVKGARFTIPVNEIDSVYPPVNATGNYGNSIAHITFKNKSYPWENSILAEKVSALESGFVHDDVQVNPWLALICISEDENVTPKSIKIEDLFTKSDNTFYPLSKMPVCTEKPEDPCSVIDIPMDLYESIMPREDEIEYLSHVKLIDLYDKTDDMVTQDGYFSVVVSNRFTPSGEKDIKKNKIHLVSLEGYDGYLPEGANYKSIINYKNVRLVSLFSWDVFSTHVGEVDFKHIITNIDSGPLALKGMDILERGQVPLKHITRVGEDTVSLYRGPLLPYISADKSGSTNKNADGYIIYDPENGIMDMSYSAAWQLGRLMILSNQSIASSLIRWKKNNALKFHLNSNKSVFDTHTKTALKLKEGDIVDYFSKTLSKELISNKLIGSISIDSKVKKGDR